VEYVTGTVVMALVTAWAVALTRERTEHVWPLLGGVLVAAFAFNLTRRDQDWAVVLVFPALVLAWPGIRQAFGRRTP